MIIRTGVIGYGVAGSIFHAPFLATDPHYRLDLIVTSDPGRVDHARQRYPAAQIVPTADDLWRRAADLDLVIIATPPSSHVALIETTLAHGLHTVVDKPFAPSSADARRLVASARRADRILTVFQNRRWDGDFRTVQRLVKDDALGDIYTFESRFEWWKPEGAGRWKSSTPIADGGGILYDLGTHLIDQAIMLFGEVTEAWADPVRRAPRDDTGCDADDDTFVALTHSNGTRSRLVMSSRSAIPGPRFHLLGSRAAHTSWGLDPQEAALKSGALPSDPGFGRPPSRNRSVIGIGDDVDRVPTEPGDYGAFYRLLADAITDGSPPPVDPADAIAVLELIEELHRKERTSHHG